MLDGLGCSLHPRFGGPGISVTPPWPPVSKDTGKGNEVLIEEDGVREGRVGYKAAWDCWGVVDLFWCRLLMGTDTRRNVLLDSSD